ncbi:MAG: helicase C-terminal domain-containing protein, partial [Raoultibacter sp.]
VQKLSERAADVHSGNVEPNVDNMLKITSDGRKLGLDQRIINPLLPDEPQSKVNQCVENIARIYRDGDAEKLTQMVFCDISTPKGDGSFTVYDDIRRKLEDKGIPTHEIAFIHDANTEVKKKELFAKVRSGQVRVLLGSTSKMGAGTNAQDRLVALHDLDCPWRPGDLEQRKGRIVRQGNKNKQVYIYRYVTESTFDSYLWQTVETKQKFISQIMTSKSPVRSCEDVDATALSYAEIKALCAGNPMIKEKMNLDTEVAKLKLLKAAHQSQQYKLEDRLLKTFPEQIERERQHIAGFEADIKTAKDNEAPHGEFAGMTVLGRDLSEKEAAGTAILNACKMVKDLQGMEVGNYRGFHMSLALSTFSNEYMLMLRGQMAHAIALGTDPRGNILRIDNALATIPERMEKAQTELCNLQNQQEAAKQEVDKPYAQEAELKEKSARLAELDAALNMEANGNWETDREDVREDVQEPIWEDEQEWGNDSSPDREQGADESSTTKTLRQPADER